MTVTERRWSPGRAFVADRRARVPFALIGVLLLVAGTAYASGVADQGLAGEDRSIERSMERVDADTTAALRTAAREAAHGAAAEPVTSPPDGSGGATAAIREESAFEDAFRVRLAIAGAEALSAVDAEVGDVTATASMPVVEEPADLVDARDRVTVEPVANGTATRVTFAAVTTRAVRDGDVVAERTADRTVVVAVPTLAAHERTDRFETRLDRGPTEGAGLGRQITASLYPMTWARGYAQYAGAPVENVLANRHVELSTNAGIVRTQRDVFGAADPAARGGVARATARTGLTDLLEPTGVDEDDWSERVLDAPAPGASGSGGDSVTDDGVDEAFPDESHTDEETSVAVGHAADVGASDVYEDLDGIARGAYRVESTVEADATRTRYGGPARPSSPGGSWSRVDRSRSRSASVVGGSDVPQAAPSGRVRPDRSLEFGAASREVALERTVVATWERTVTRRVGNETVRETQRTTTSASATDRYRVRIDVTGRYAPTGDAPTRGTATFGAGEWAAGPDLTDTPDAARSDLDVATAGGVDRIARDAVHAGRVSRSTTVVGERPDGLTDAVAADVDELRREVRAMETELELEAAAAADADPYDELIDDVEDDRSSLVDAPRTYDGAADRARVSAREAYLDAVVRELGRADRGETTASEGIVDRIEGALDGPSVGDVIESREAARESDPYAVGRTGPGESVTFTPEGSPGYLPRTAVDEATVDAVNGTTTRPLTTRNLNYVTVPYEDVASGIVDRILGSEDSVRIGTAGRALLAADDSLAEREDSDLRADRDALESRVERSLAEVDRDLVDALGARTELSPGDRRAAVRAAARTYDTPGDRAVAVEEGTYADRVAEHAAARGGRSTDAECRLAAHLRVTMRATADRDAVTVPARFVDGPVEKVRGEFRDRLEDAVEDSAERAGEEAAERWAPKPARSVGAGLPVAPLPGYWVATVNGWRVEVRGEYPRFTLRADVGPPEERFAYVRTDDDVTVDVDGETIDLGSTDPVRFETGTVVAVAVPAGPPGVGDVDGTRDETSPGWPCPGDAAVDPDANEPADACW